MSVLRRMAFCLFYAAVFAVPTSAQDSQLLRSVDSLGLDPTLFLETGYFTNTLDGYTVVRGTDERWYHARLNEFGNVVPTDMPVGVLGKQSAEELAFLPRAARHLETNPTIKDQLEQSANHEEAAIDRSRIQLTQKGFASGTRDILVLGIEFPDHRAPYGIGYLDSLMNFNTLESGTGSFKDYYIENSYGKFVPESHVHGWYEAEHPLAFYTDTLSPQAGSQQLAKEALDQADLAGVNLKGFDFDGDRHADPVLIVTTASSSQIPARFSELLEPVKHQSFYFEPFTFQDVHLGNLVHEYGHALGLHDLYKYLHTFGYYDVMALSCFGEPPGHFSAYSKMLLGWIDPVVIDKSTEGLLVPNSHDHPFAVKIDGKNTTDGRYFLIENRIQKGYDSGGYATVPGSGLLIYHIDEYDRPWSHVEQADGRQDLEEYATSDGELGNPADAGDFFPGATNNSSFDRDTTPSSREDDGSDTGVDILEISPPLDTMRLSVELRGLPVAAPEGRWVEDQIHSTALEGALLRPATVRTVRVYLPAAYDEFPDARFPVLYMLPPSWTTGTYTWMDVSGFIDHLGAGPTLDAAFGMKGIRPMIVVFPDVLGPLPHYFTKSHVVGNWEDFVAKDLVSYIDETYRTISDAAGRGISGLQLGGYGAIMIGTGHPDTFRSVYALASVDLDFKDIYVDLTEVRDAMKEVATHPPGLDDFASLSFFLQVVVAACVSYTPDSTASPLPCNLPFDADGNVIEDVWDEWLRHDPYTLLASPEYRENLLELNGLGFDCAPGVVWNINANRLFAQALQDAGIPPELRAYREYVGDMADLLDERIRDYVIPFISDHVEGEIVTSIEEEWPKDKDVPRTFALHQNYPNPFNPTTTIQYDLPGAASVRLTVFDALGRKVRVLGTGYQVPGSYSVRFDAADLPSGIYFYRLEAGNYVTTKSLVLTE